MCDDLEADADQDQGSGDADEVAAESANSLPPSGREIDVFVSYRVDPDEPLAEELKALLEGAIEPTPSVFVSGAGGLEVSSVGFRQQLQEAAQQASAFIAIITQASTEREWLFFEAGAAFGRGVIYAPLLIDTARGELPSSIGGSQAVKASDQHSIRRMVHRIAQELGSKLKPRFGNRYSRFARAVENYGKEDKGESGSPPDIIRAMRLMESSREDEAAQLFSQLMGEAKTPGGKARIEIAKAISSPREERTMLEALDDVPPEHRETSIYQLWRGDKETNPREGMRHLEAALDGDMTGFFLAWATTRMAEREVSIGDLASARQRLLQAAGSTDRVVRSAAARALAKLFDDTDKFGALLLHLISLDRETNRRSTLDFCHTHGFTTIGLYLASREPSTEATGSDSLTRGLLRHQAGLHSLAYLDYSKAAHAGLGVAKSNMAVLLESGPVPGAAVELLRQHEGDYNARNPGIPHAVRGRVEQSLSEDTRKEDALRASGEQVFQTLRYCADLGFSKLGPGLSGAPCTWQARDEWTISWDGQDLEVKHADRTLEVSKIEPFPCLFVASERSEIRLIVSLGSQASAWTLPGFAEPGETNLIALTPVAAATREDSAPRLPDDSQPLPASTTGAERALPPATTDDEKQQSGTVSVRATTPRRGST